jgi:sulfate permease, SulP family
MEPQERRFVDVRRRSNSRVIPGVVVYRLDDRLFFANSRYFTTRIREAVAGAPYPVSAVVFDGEAVVALDASGAETLRELTDELRARGIRLVLARTRTAFDSNATRLGLDDVLPSGSHFPTVRAAVLSVSGVDVEALGNGPASSGDG